MAEVVNGIPAIIVSLGHADAGTVAAVAELLKSQFQGVIVLAGISDPGSVALVAAVTPEFTQRIQAGRLIQEIAPIVGGKGGGRPDSARGGGKDASRIGEALARSKALL